MKNALFLWAADPTGGHRAEGVFGALRAVYDGLFCLESREGCEGLTEDLLLHYEAVILWAEVSDRAAAAAIAGYTAAGGRTLALHRALASEQPELLLMFGAQCEETGSQILLDYFPEESPSGISFRQEPFKVTEVPMFLTLDTLAPRDVFLSHTYGNAREPAGWCRKYGHGRVVCLTPGYSADSFQPPLRRLLWRAGQWLTFRL